MEWVDRTKRGHYWISAKGSPSPKLIVAKTHAGSYLWLVPSDGRWLARGDRGEGIAGEEVARGDGPDHGGNLKLVFCPGRWGVLKRRGLGGVLRWAKGLGCPRNLPLPMLATVLVGLNLWGDFGRCLGDGGVVFDGEGRGASRGFHTGQEGDLNNTIHWPQHLKTRSQYVNINLL